jgi:hypothetical protein
MRGKLERVVTKLPYVIVYKLDQETRTIHVIGVVRRLQRHQGAARPRCQAEVAHHHSGRHANDFANRQCQNRCQPPATRSRVRASSAAATSGAGTSRQPKETSQSTAFANHVPMCGRYTLTIN